jgi:hypothetical protein
MSADAAPDRGSMSFVQYQLPGLRSAAYSLTATQAVSVLGQGDTFEATQAFFVAGVRYRLDDSAVDSVFPPPGSQGEFDDVLPHVVLTDPTLPWQRSPDARSATGIDAVARRAGAATGAPVPTWLALLLFDEADRPPGPQSLTIADLAGRDGIFHPPRAPEYGEQPTDPVAVIDVPVGQFAELAPSLADLAWLAHTRVVSTEAKATATSAGPAEFALVFGGRLPAPGRASTVYLVSLEGFGPYLPSDDGVAPATVPAGTTKVRLAVLRSWTFAAIDLRQTFRGLLEGLDMNPASLQLPVQLAPATTGDAEATVAQAFGMGYTAMNHGLRDGSSTVSWYRGPLLPLGVGVPPLTRSQASDELLRYDPGTGMFDVTYAAAWELGRLMALRDRGFAAALYRWRLTVTQQAAAELEEEIVDQLLPPLPGDQPTDPDDSARPPGHRRLARVIRDVVGPAAGQLARPHRAGHHGPEHRAEHRPGHRPGRKDGH